MGAPPLRASVSCYYFGIASGVHRRRSMTRQWHDRVRDCGYTTGWRRARDSWP